MSFRVFFSLSTGLSKSVRVPKGTFARISKHVSEVEQVLGLETEQYLDNPPRWKRNKFLAVSDETLCKVAEEHNQLVRWLYLGIIEWREKTPKPSEWLTPAKAATVWHALETIIDVPPERWTNDYYRARMEAVYAAMRGFSEIESEGASLGTKALTPKQAGAVIVLFSGWLDRGDIRLDVPNGHDELRASDDGGYLWCEKCGAVAEEDVADCRKRGCPIREEEEA